MNSKNKKMEKRLLPIDYLKEEKYPHEWTFDKKLLPTDSIILFPLSHEQNNFKNATDALKKLEGKKLLNLLQDDSSDGYIIPKVKSSTPNLLEYNVKNIETWQLSLNSGQVQEENLFVTHTSPALCMLTSSKRENSLSLRKRIKPYFTSNNVKGISPQDKPENGKLGRHLIYKLWEKLPSIRFNKITASSGTYVMPTYVNLLELDEFINPSKTNDEDIQSFEFDINSYFLNLNIEERIILRFIIHENDNEPLFELEILERHRKKTPDILYKIGMWINYILYENNKQ